MQAGSGYQAQKPVLALHHAPALIPRDARPHLSPAHVHPSEGAPQAQAHHGHPGRDLLPEPTPAHSHPCNPDAAARFWPAESLHASPRCRPSESRLSSPAGGGCLRHAGTSAQHSDPGPGWGPCALGPHPPVMGLPAGCRILSWGSWRGVPHLVGEGAQLPRAGHKPGPTSPPRGDMMASPCAGGGEGH